MTLRVTFLCSGGGGNLRLLHALANGGALPFVSITGVIADRECPALDWARSHGIQAERQAYTRSSPDALHGALEAGAPDLIVTNIHKILDDRLVTRFQGRLVNLHYSLLPAFAGAIGMESVRLARAHGCRFVGATAHLVTAELDAGPILAQACVVDDGEQPESIVHDAVFRCGGVALAAAVDVLFSPSDVQAGDILRAGMLPIFAAPRPRPHVAEVFRDEGFWERLR